MLSCRRCCCCWHLRLWPTGGKKPIETQDVRKTRMHRRRQRGAGLGGLAALVDERPHLKRRHCLLVVLSEVDYDINEASRPPRREFVDQCAWRGWQVTRTNNRVR